MTPRKLSAAHALLVKILSAGPQFVASCITLAAEAGLSTRTLFEARRRLPIECINREPLSRGWWRLAGDPGDPPEEWRPRRQLRCRVCGELMPGAHWRRRRCRACGGR